MSLFFLHFVRKLLLPAGNLPYLLDEVSRLKVKVGSMPCVRHTGPSLQRAGFFYIERIIAGVPVLGVFILIVQVHQQADLVFHEPVVSHLARGELQTGLRIINYPSSIITVEPLIHTACPDSSGDLKTGEG